MSEFLESTPKSVFTVHILESTPKSVLTVHIHDVKAFNGIFVRYKSMIFKLLVVSISPQSRGRGDLASQS